MNWMQQLLAVCWGGGWDSTAMLIRMVKMGLRPEIITMADTGGEKPGTYNFVPIFSHWLVEQGFPRPVICRYRPLDVTQAKYREATRQAADRLGIRASDEQINRLAGLFGNMVANDTLPSLVFGMKGCSFKWKIEAQEPI